MGERWWTRNILKTDYLHYKPSNWAQKSYKQSCRVRCPWPYQDRTALLINSNMEVRDDTGTEEEYIAIGCNVLCDQTICNWRHKLYLALKSFFGPRRDYVGRRTRKSSARERRSACTYLQIFCDDPGHCSSFLMVLFSFTPLSGRAKGHLTVSLTIRHVFWVTPVHSCIWGDSSLHIIHSSGKHWALWLNNSISVPHPLAATGTKWN